MIETGDVVLLIWRKTKCVFNANSFVIDVYCAIWGIIMVYVNGSLWIYDRV